MAPTPMTFPRVEKRTGPNFPNYQMPPVSGLSKQGHSHLLNRCPAHERTGSHVCVGWTVTWISYCLVRNRNPSLRPIVSLQAGDHRLDPGCPL